MADFVNFHGIFTVTEKLGTLDDAPRLASRISAQNCLHKQSTVRSTRVKWPCLQLSRRHGAGDAEGYIDELKSFTLSMPQVRRWQSMTEAQSRS